MRGLRSSVRGTGAIVALGAALVLLGGCVARDRDVSENERVALALSGSAGGDPQLVPHGARVYAQYCAQCHGATGREGGAGPSLTDRGKNRNIAATEVWIAQPVAPMPRLPLAGDDVRDVANYVASL